MQSLETPSALATSEEKSKQDTGRESSHDVGHGVAAKGEVCAYLKQLLHLEKATWKSELDSQRRHGNHTIDLPIDDDPDRMQEWIMAEANNITVVVYRMGIDYFKKDELCEFARTVAEEASKELEADLAAGKGLMGILSS